MKKLIIAFAITAAVGATAGAAFAQAGDHPQWQSSQSHAQASMGPKTRAQVYEELVQAQNDGSLDHLNSALYRHP
jgi:hypothetical protein